MSRRRGHRALVVCDIHTYWAGIMFRKILDCEEGKHGLNLLILNVDDIPQDNFENTIWILFIGNVRTHHLASFVEKSLGHVDRILMMRDHLLQEDCSSAVGSHPRGHSHHHETVHCVDTVTKLLETILCVFGDANKSIWTLQVGESGTLQVERAQLASKGLT
jgi:hypothetical protein